MVSVVNCESGFTQLVNGKPFMSHTSDVGVMQINRVHWKEAKDLGLDIFNSASDNIKFGRILYDREGRAPWVCNRLV